MKQVNDIKRFPLKYNRVHAVQSSLTTLYKLYIHVVGSHISWKIIKS